MLSIWAIDIALCLCTSSLPRLTARVSLAVKRQRELHVKVLERHTPIRQSNWELFSLLSPSINPTSTISNRIFGCCTENSGKSFLVMIVLRNGGIPTRILCICCWQYRTHFGSNRRRFSGTPPSDPWILLPRPSAVVGYSHDQTALLQALFRDYWLQRLSTAVKYGTLRMLWLYCHIYTFLENIVNGSDS